MAKRGLPHAEWLERIKDFAAGKFEFKRGNHPPANSPWRIIIDKISKCPMHKAVKGKDFFGKPVECLCGYHKSTEKQPAQKEQQGKENPTTGKSPANKTFKSRFQYAKVLVLFILN